MSIIHHRAKNSHVERSPRRQETGQYFMRLRSFDMTALADDGFSFSPFGPPRFSDTCSLRAEAKQDEDASITDDNGTSVGLAETTATPTSYTTGPGLLRKLFPSIGHRKQRSQGRSAECLLVIADSNRPQSNERVARRRVHWVSAYLGRKNGRVRSWARHC